MLKTALLSIALSTFVGFVSYCIIFDKRRRSDPNYKKKVRERRMNANQPINPFHKYNISLNDSIDKKREFFFQQMQLGEELLAYNKLDLAAEHFANAVIFSAQPEPILNFMAARLPDIIISKIYEKYELVSKQCKEYENFMSKKNISKSKSTDVATNGNLVTSVDNIVIDID